MDVEVSLQARGGKEQRVTLRTSLQGRAPIIGVAENPDITRAPSKAKRELIRQLEHQKSTRDPMKSPAQQCNDPPLACTPFEIT